MKLRFSIRTKLVGIINLILVTAAAAIVGFATTLFSRDNVARVQESNLESARLLAQEIRNDLTNLTEKMKLLGVSLLQNLTPAQMESLHRPFFESEKDLLAETVLSLAEATPTGPKVLGRATHEQLLKTLDVPVEEVQRLHEELSQGATALESFRAGTETITPGQLRGNIPVMTLALPLMMDDRGQVTHMALATLKQDRFLKAVSSEGLVTSYLVDARGYVMAHPDQQRVLKRENVAHLEIVKRLLAGKSNNGQTRFVDPATQIAYLGAFKTLGFAGMGVVSQVEEAKALEAADKVRKTSTIITGMVAVAAFLVVFFFSLSLTRPLLRLVDATEQVAHGNYNIALKKGANDEIGDLTRSFTEMAQGLAEREKIKNAFSKFHSKDVADKILSGELSLVGERKKVTIFFSDIRSFTSISEKLEPEQVVELVNSYMTRMVRIIFAHGGVVDKYVGDAIMAVYGTPVSYGNDAVRAVSAAIRMRAELQRFNDSQSVNGKPVIGIGMGMHTGDVVAGNIGSPERMEYTILGDNVNLTSRMESLTKEYKTDILISQATYEEVKQYIHCVARGTTKVKGKAEEVSVYEVLGFIEGREWIPPEGKTGETEETLPTLEVRTPVAVPLPTKPTIRPAVKERTRTITVTAPIVPRTEVDTQTTVVPQPPVAKPVAAPVATPAAPPPPPAPDAAIDVPVLEVVLEPKDDGKKAA